MGGGPARNAPASTSPATTARDVGHQDTRSTEAEYDELITTQSSESDPDTVHVHLRVRPGVAMASSTPGSSSSPATPSNGTACTLKYCKSACYIHPSSYSRDNVQGWIAISKRGRRDFLLSWIPDAMVRSEDKDKFVRVEIGADGELEVEDEGKHARGISPSLPPDITLFHSS